MKTGIKGCFPPGRIFRAQRNFSLFVSSQVELIEKEQVCLEENQLRQQHVDSNAVSVFLNIFLVLYRSLETTLLDAASSIIMVRNKSAVKL